MGNNYGDGYEHPDEYLSADKRVWLPRQDQLLEIVCENPKPNLWNTPNYMLARLWRFIEDKRARYASLEQLWLAFVMWRLYCKVWDEDKEDWVRLEGCDD